MGCLRSKKFFCVFGTGVIALVLYSSHALALSWGGGGGSGSSGTGGGIRTKKRIGVLVTTYGDPMPTYVGGNLCYNWTRAVRLVGAYGYATYSGIQVQTLGGGLRLMIPSWRFTPIVGPGYSRVTASTKFKMKNPVTGDSVGEFKTSQSVYYVAGGFDYTMMSGINIGLGYVLSLKPAAGGLPFFNIGLFF